MKSNWIRTNVNGKTGHAGRNGYIIPGPKDGGVKFIGYIYGSDECFSSSLVNDLKKLLDGVE